MANSTYGEVGIGSRIKCPDTKGVYKNVKGKTGGGNAVTLTFDDGTTSTRPANTPVTDAALFGPFPA